MPLSETDYELFVLYGEGRFEEAAEWCVFAAVETEDEQQQLIDRKERPPRASKWRRHSRAFAAREQAGSRELEPYVERMDEMNACDFRSPAVQQT